VTEVSLAVLPLPQQLEQSMQRTGMWADDCPVPLQRLSLIRIRYVDFAGIERDDGELVAFDVAAEYIAAIFETLFEMRFPLAKIRSVHHYGGNDDLSMADNNSSCFCHRPIEGTTLASLHSYGLAVDVNPLQNPFIVFNEEEGTAKIHPSQGWEFLNRHNRKPGMVEDLVELFAARGFFIWGGRWTTPIDLHHFQTPRGLAELLVAMDQADGQRLFNLCIAHRDQLKTMPSGERLQPLLAQYRSNPDKFFQTFIETIASV
jgi:hypothetical protein